MSGGVVERDIQRRYYATTADQYDEAHFRDGDEHYVALSALTGMLPLLGARSVLDVGAGTGRGVAFLTGACNGIRVVGVEPVPELVAVGIRKGLSQDALLLGDATDLQFEDASFDVVCATGVLHHVRQPERAIAEMLRVARKAVFISDSNRFGQGPVAARLLKRLLWSLGLWPLANYLKTRGRGYTLTEGDGLAYSYSVFDNYDLLRASCSRIHHFNTIPSGPCLRSTAGHVALLGIKSGGS